MIGKNILVFGGSGQIGRHLIRRLTNNNHLVTVATRNLHTKGSILKTQGNPGYIEIIETNIFEEEKLYNLIKDKDVCINLVGILYESKKNTFKNIHVNFPNIISRISEERKLDQFIHISALGIEKAKDSLYASSKLEGEMKIIKNFPKATILRPSIIYSIDDNFTTNLMSLLNLMPFFPIYYNGKTKFSPLHVFDMSEIILSIIEKNICSEIIECVGPEEMSFKQILEKLLFSIDRKKILIPFPLVIAKLLAFFLEKFPKPLLTRDQLNLLKYDNVLSGNHKSNIDIGFISKLKFENEIKKYSYMWKKGGQYSK